MQHAFCGSCGSRWDRKGSKSRPKKGEAEVGSKQGKTHSQHAEYVLPTFDFPALSLSSSSGSHAFFEPMPQQAPQNASKSVKAVLHQRANRIGKVEARIQKLEFGLQEVCTNWPRYVHAHHQQLIQEHAKCVQFCHEATKELKTLKNELATLTSTAPLQALPSQVDAKQPPVMPAGMDPVFVQQVQSAMTLIHQQQQQQQQSATMPSLPSSPAPTYQAPMEVDDSAHLAAGNPTMNMFPMPAAWADLRTVMPNVPSVSTLPLAYENVAGTGIPMELPSGQKLSQDASTTAMPVLPAPISGASAEVGAAMVHPVTTAQNDLKQPPGVWDWPPPVPDLPAHMMQIIDPSSSAPVTMPKLSPGQHAQMTMPEVLTPPRTSPTGQAPLPVSMSPPSAELLKIVLNAEEGLKELQEQTTGEPAAELTPEMQQQLEQFAQQQAFCHAQIQAFQTAAKQRKQQQRSSQPTTPVAQPTVLAPPVPAGSQLPSDHWSVTSSPAKPQPSTGKQPEHYQMNTSPPGERRTKISKTLEGPVHSQPSGVDGLPTPPDSEIPSPVPTEVATEDGDPETMEAESRLQLQQLE